MSDEVFTPAMQTLAEEINSIIGGNAGPAITEAIVDLIDERIERAARLRRKKWNPDNKPPVMPTGLETP